MDYDILRTVAFRAGYSTRGQVAWITPVLHFTSLGRPYSQNLTGASSIYWLDAGTSWTASNTQMDFKTAENGDRKGR